MTTTKLFGEFLYSRENGTDFNIKELTLNGRVQECRASIHEGLDEEELKKAIIALDSLEVLDKKAREELHKDFESEEEVYEFIDIHFNDYGSEVREKIFEKLNIDLSSYGLKKNEEKEIEIGKKDQIAFLENIEMGSLFIYKSTEDNELTITLDYSIIWQDGSSFTDQILGVTFNDKLEYLYHSHDS